MKKIFTCELCGESGDASEVQGDPAKAHKPYCLAQDDRPLMEILRDAKAEPKR